MIRPVATQTFEAQISLSEAEVRVLEHLAGYEQGLIDAIDAKVTKNYAHEVLLTLLKRWRSEMGECIKRFDAAKQALREFLPEVSWWGGAGANPLFWLHLPEGVSGRRVTEAAAGRGVPGSKYSAKRVRTRRSPGV